MHNRHRKEEEFMMQILEGKEEFIPQQRSSKKHSKLPKKYSITFTHLNPKSIPNFVEALKHLFSDVEMETVEYINSL